MTEKPNIVVIGGGIIGLACAHYLSKKGLSVTIIEQDSIGSGASHGNCGLLHYSGAIPLCSPGAVRHEIFRSLLGVSPLYIKPRLDLALFHWLFQFSKHCNNAHMDKASREKTELLTYSRDLFDVLQKNHQFKCDFDKSGILLVFKDKKYFEKYRATNAYLKQFNLDGKCLTKAKAMDLEPSLNHNIVGAFYNQHDWHLKPEKLLSEWKQNLLEKEVKFKAHCKLIDFESFNGKIKHAITTEGNIDADAFVLTTGAWSSKIQNKLGLRLPVQPGKGYSITLEKPNNSPQIPCLLYERNMVVTPWEKELRLGGTMEFSGFDTNPNKKRLTKLISGTKEYLSTPVNQPVVEEWNGLRPMVYDDMPIIDRSSIHDNLFLGLGHGMLGLTLATGTGRIISDLILGESPEIDITPYSLSRF